MAKEAYEKAKANITKSILSNKALEKSITES